MNKSITIENRSARHEYFIEDTLECGIELRGNEVKSIREGKASIKEAWVAVENGELFIKQMHITQWKTANQYDVDEKRDKKLLAHKNEINKLGIRVRQDGYTLIPLKIYFNDRGKCKVLLGVCKGKHLYDKRQANKEKTTKREMDKVLKDFR
jgi:SsrA-binding protein